MAVCNGIPFKDRTSLPGVWFPAHSNVTCTGKGVEIDPTNRLTRITIITIHDSSID